MRSTDQGAGTPCGFLILWMICNQILPMSRKNLREIGWVFSSGSGQRARGRCLLPRRLVGWGLCIGLLSRCFDRANNLSIMSTQFVISGHRKDKGACDGSLPCKSGRVGNGNLVVTRIGHEAGCQKAKCLLWEQQVQLVFRGYWYEAWIQAFSGENLYNLIHYGVSGGEDWEPEEEDPFSCFERDDDNTGAEYFLAYHQWNASQARLTNHPTALVNCCQFKGSVIVWSWFKFISLKIDSYILGKKVAYCQLFQDGRTLGFLLCAIGAYGKEHSQPMETKR